MRVRLCQLTAGARFVACAPFFAKVARQTLARALRVLPSCHGSETSRFAGLWSFSAKHTPMPFWADIAPRLGREAARVRKVARVARNGYSGASWAIVTTRAILRRYGCLKAPLARWAAIGTRTDKF
eukprot:7375949-Prymnesium_polylepis.3